MAGVAAGIVAGFLIPFEPSGLNQYMSVGIAFGIAIVTYIISVMVGRSVGRDVPKEKRRKIATEGIVPFMFLLLVFMIIVYTALHQSSILT